MGSPVVPWAGGRCRVRCAVRRVRRVSVRRASVPGPPPGIAATSPRPFGRGRRSGAPRDRALAVLAAIRGPAPLGRATLERYARPRGPSSPKTQDVVVRSGHTPLHDVAVDDSGIPCGQVPRVCGQPCYPGGGAVDEGRCDREGAAPRRVRMSWCDPPEVPPNRTTVLVLEKWIGLASPGARRVGAAAPQRPKRRARCW